MAPVPYKQRLTVGQHGGAGDCSALQRLMADGNQLKALPDSLRRLQSLAVISAAGNKCGTFTLTQILTRLHLARMTVGTIELCDAGCKPYLPVSSASAQPCPLFICKTTPSRQSRFASSTVSMCTMRGG